MARKQGNVEPEATTDPVENAVLDPEAEARTKSYGFADKTLREKYEGEFNALRKQFMADAGYPDWEPRSVVAARKAEAKAAEDRAKAESTLAKLLRENPHLADQFGALSAVQGDSGAEAQSDASEAQSA